MSVKIAIFREAAHERTLEFTARVMVVGRSAEADIVLESETVSRRHCELKLKKVGLTIKDLGSRNGTSLNGQPIVAGTRIPISVGDLVKVGRYRLRIDQVALGADAQPSADAQSGTNHRPHRLPDNFAGLNRLAAPVSSALDQDHSLDELEELIRRRSSQRKDVTEAKTVASIKLDDDPLPVVTRTFHATDNRITESDESSVVQAQSDTTETQSGATETQSDTTETVELPANEKEADNDISETLRLAFRKQLEGLNAKDSQEAATRALKHLFGG